VLGGVAFAIAATANAAGYRYGVSDQAFYIPAVIRALVPAAFPRDQLVIDAQARFMLVDEALAGVVRATGLPLDLLFFAGYVLSLGLLYAGLMLIGRRVYASPWLIAALVAAFTLRHRIPQTSANSFEPYFHPRMLAFALGTIAIACLLRRRLWPAIALVAASAAVHVTTALWFAILVGTAIVVLDRRWRIVAGAGGAVGIALAAWAIAAGPWRDALTTMDATWLQAVASKDSLFPTDWPVWVWAANLGLVPVLWALHRRRVSRGQATAEDTAVMWGATALAVVFLVTLPLVANAIALPVQLQISRVFWLLDLLATVYLLTLFEHGPAKAGPHVHGPPKGGPYVLAILLATVSAARGVYIILIEQTDRPLVQLHLADTPWHDAMRWLRQQPVGVHVLADPGHAWRFGTSVRVSGERDVFIEDVKDSAIAIYSRDVATRVVERLPQVSDFNGLTPDAARTLAARYDLDLLITETDLPLPLAYRNDRFRIYNLEQ
jgi:hypothetical protein